MKLIRKLNLFYLLIILTIVIQIIYSLESEALIQENKIQSKKFRNVMDICSMSSPNWTKKNGNIPCPPKTICRPSLTAQKSGLTGVPSKCYPDNKKGKKMKNFQFRPSKSRKISTSYTFRYRENNGPWIIVAGEMQECYRSTPNYQARKCLPGLVCAPLDNQIRLTGIVSFCQKPNKVKISYFLREGDKCKLNSRKMCPPSTICRLQVKDTHSRKGNLIYIKRTQGYFCLADSPKIKNLVYIPANHRCIKSLGTRCSPGNVCRNFYLGNKNKGTFCLPSIPKNKVKFYKVRVTTTSTRYINGVKVSEVTY